MREIDILGHHIDAQGITFSREKLQGVLQFPLPETVTSLQSFLGLGAYFRDNVRNMSLIEKPLRKLVSDHKNAKSAKIRWTDETKQSFNEVRDAVWNCSKLFFYDDQLPIFLHTDACNTGIGAYLFQHDAEKKEIPIGFMSRALDERKQRWSTFEQEGYAIHEALRKFYYLIRDRSFILRTDHRNLLYMNDSGASDKVLRWKLHIQQYDF